MVSLLAVLAFVGLAPLATGVWRVIDINREALATSTQQFQLLLASSIAEKMDFKIEGVLSELAQASQAVDAQVHEGGGAVSAEQIGNALAHVLDDRIRYLHYTDLSRPGDEPIAVGALPDALVGSFERFASDTVLPAAEASGRDGRVVLSRPVLLEDQSVLFVSVPAVTGGDQPRVLSAAVDLRSMWDSVTAQSPGGNVVYALDRSGRVFASTDPSQVRPGDDLNHSTPVKRFFSGHGRARETLPYTDFHEGVETRYLGSFETTNQGWGVFVRSELQHVYAPVHRLARSTVTWMLLVLGVAALFAVAFAMSLSRPIKQLAVASRAFARGEFSTRVDVRARNEIGELAHTFNGMATEIETHIDKLLHAAQENSELFEGTILALAKAIDAKDRYTKGHSVRVNEYSVILARHLGLSTGETHDIHVASLLHDVGKIGVDDAILKKPGKLTPEEYEIIKTHAAIGAGIMSSIPQMKDILPGLRWHHERMDGSGYPDRLRGAQIPVMARIIAVADTFDAVTSDRSYQRTRSFAEGLQLLHDLKGELDPEVVDAFDRACRVGEIRPRTPRPRHAIRFPEPAPA